MDVLLAIMVFLSLAVITIGIISLLVKLILKNGVSYKTHFKSIGISIGVLIVSFIFIGIIETNNNTATNDDTQPDKVNASPKVENKKNEEKENRVAEENKEDEKPIRSKEINDFVNKIASKTYGTSIKKIIVNENLVTEQKEDFIVLVYLSFDMKNGIERTKEMINMGNNDIGGLVGKNIDNVTELTIFWEVPYHAKGKNVAKANLSRQENKMIFEEEWYDPILR